MNKGKHQEDGGQGEDAIRSVAVVKNSQVEFPVSFRKLQSDTDLKRPPSNWFQGQIINPNYSSKHSGFTSFIMGYQFPDCIGEVDIVSDAENIKKLLKIPYNPNTHMSMMVHRIGRTILIDEFDVSQYVLRQTQYQWKWLRKFFYEFVLESMPRKEMNVLVRPNKSRNVVQSKNLLSKFLHYSIEEKNDITENKESTEGSPVSVRTISSPVKDSHLELPVEENIPHATVQPFIRNIIWNFEDLRMLIGTDLPIFGGVTHPCVSLRLTDMNKPINVLTGIDYWLDNLMCNVPEVIMCYHIDGIVKKYEFIKTEDLPRMADSQFSPQLVRDIAHNILSFLKSKATKEGHTYWLFKSASKEEKDAIVKLYDLTSLCNERILDLSEEYDPNYVEDNDNPFTIPVAMLFYCVAKNMWNSQDSSSQYPTIRSLLENSLNLLTLEKHSKIICQSHYILSDIYLPQYINPDSPHISDESDQDENVDDEEEQEVLDQKKKKKREIPSIKVSSLCLPFVPKKIKQKISEPPKLTTDIRKRCDLSMQHVIIALNCIISTIKERHKQATQDATLKSGDQKNFAKENFEEPRMAKPYEPIPMPYSSLSDSNKISSNDSFNNLEESNKKITEEVNNKKLTLTLDRKVDGTKAQKIESLKTESSKSDSLNLATRESRTSIMPKTLVTDSVMNSHFKDASWSDKMQFKLLRKASLVFMTKSKLEFDDKNYGTCLRNAKLALHAWACMGTFFGQDLEFPFPSQPLLVAGDTYYYLSKNWNSAATYIEQFNSRTKEHETMADILDSIISGQDCNWIIKIPCDAVESLKFSYLCYESTLSTAKCRTDSFNLKRKLASVCNELACLLMNQAHQICQGLAQGIEAGGTLWDDSRFYLKKGLSLFEDVEDKVNIALLHSNYGRLLRVCAFHNSNRDEGQVYTPFVKRMHQECFKEYEMALDILKYKSLGSTQFYDSVIWDYGTALFNYGTLLQDDPNAHSMNQEILSKQIIELYDKALKLCDTKTQGKNLPLYQYRAAVLHHRLAGIYHQLYRDNSGGEKKMRHLAELNYSRSCHLFLSLEHTTDSLKSHLDYVVLLEDVIKKTNGFKSQWKIYLQILKLICDCLPILNLIEEQKDSSGTGEVKSTGEVKTKLRTKKGKGKNEQLKAEDKQQERITTNVEEKIKTKEDEKTDDEEDVLKSLSELYEKKLQSSLLALIKLSKSADKSLHCYQDDVKSMYASSLNKTKLDLTTHLLQAVTDIKYRYDKSRLPET